MKKLALIALLIAGCTPLQRFPAENRQQFEVVYEHEIGAEDREFLLSSIDYVVACWQRDFQVRSRSATISIVSHLWIEHPVGKVKGTYCADTNTIRVVLGQFSNLPALYHELCHLNIEPRSHDHGSWNTWDDRALDVSWELRKQWFDRED